MAPNFQSSFIPKESPTEVGFKKKPIGIIGMIAVLLFISSLLAFAGLFVYKRMVKSEIKLLKMELVEAEKSIDTKAINEMFLFSKKLDVIKGIVNKHQAITNVLDIIASSTVNSIYYNDFNYTSSVPGVLTIVLHGKARGFADIALQESILSQNKYFKTITFANMIIGDKGLVLFDLTISVDPEASIYSKEAPTPVVVEDLDIEESTALSEDVSGIDVDLNMSDL